MALPLADKGQAVVDAHHAGNRPGGIFDHFTLAPAMDLAFQAYPATALDMDAYVVRFHFRIALQCVFDPALDVVRLDARLDGNVVENTFHASQQSDFGFGSGALILPSHFATETYPTTLHLHHDGANRHYGAPAQDIQGPRCNLVISGLLVFRISNIDILRDSQNAFDALSRALAIRWLNHSDTTSPVAVVLLLLLLLSRELMPINKPSQRRRYIASLLEARMAIKEILLYLPTWPDAPAARTLESAVQFAQLQPARITAEIVELDKDRSTWPPSFGAWPLDISSLMEEMVDKSEANAVQLERSLSELGREYGVQLHIRRGTTTPYAPSKPLVEGARLHDLVIMPTPESDSFGRYYIQSVIFGSGRPTLLLPSQSRSRALHALDTVVVAWDFGREAARAMNDAMPILIKARKVHVICATGEKSIMATTLLAELERYLAIHNVNSIMHCKDPASEPIGEILNGFTHEVSADLLVMGAYGHSRFREFVLGGATASVLANPLLPTLLSH